MSAARYYTTVLERSFEDRKTVMKKFVFDSVNEAELGLDVSATHTAVKNARGLLFLTKSGEDLARNEDHATDLLRFIESYDLKRELEAQFAESGKIDMTPADGKPPIGDDFDSVIALNRLFESWKKRRNNVTEMKKRKP